MVSRNEFLASVLPTLKEGECYCAVGIKSGSVKQEFAYSLDEVSRYADDFVAGGFNAFFALAKFSDAAEGRTTKNATAFKSFFVDIDCGPNKPYPDLQTGINALKEFCKKSKLPRPTVVKSGLGAHAYWTLTEEIERKEWTARAETLKDICKHNGFDVDPSVTSDAARVLRIPDTLHVKDPTNPLPVEVLFASAPMDSKNLDQILPRSMSLENAPQRKFELDALTLSLMGNKQVKFRTILAKSLEGNGCAQLLNIVQNQETIPEPLWRAGLSIAERCVDRAKAIHAMSSKHPEYSAEDTEKKAAATKGPYTCATFKKLNPLGCEGCPLTVSSPIQIGEELAEATEEDNVVVGVERVTEEQRQYVIPKYPFPYLRGKNGGVYWKVIRENAKGEEEEKVELVCEHDFYVVKRMIDPDMGQTILIRVHMPKEGVEDFVMPLTALVSKEACIKMLAHHGITALQKRQELLMMYLDKWVKHLQSEVKAAKAHRQYGWTDDNSQIVIGERVISGTEIEYCPPSASTLTTSAFMRPKGDFQQWKNIINHYATPGQEYRAFAFFLGFGTMLMRFTALEGFSVNLVGRTSGTGKSTLLEAINSIYGHPKKLMLNFKDTANVRMQRMGVMQNLAVTIDEITNMDPEAMSQLMYDVTSGRGKHRMKQHENSERSNDTAFQTGLISSSNRSVVDALMSIKAMPDGEMKRILEIVFPESSVEDATWSRKHFEPLRDNYGHAIEPYAQTLIAHQDLVKAKLNEIRDRVDKVAEVRNSERFWSLIVALSITGGTIAKKLGLHDIPIKPVFEYGVNLIKSARESSRERMFDADDFLGAFMGKHFAEILVINGIKPARGFEPGPIKEPRGALTMRYEPDTKMLFVASNAYQSACSRLKMNYEESLVPYKKSKALIIHPDGASTKRKRLFAGTSANNNTQTSCLWFDTTKLDSFKEEALLGKDTESETSS